MIEFLKLVAGLALLGSPFLLAISFIIISMRFSSNDYNPNAKHYCAWCRKLEWECNCPDC